MLKSLLSQVYSRNEEINPVFPEDIKALEMQWTSVLYELSEKSDGEKIVVVIDALDELNGNDLFGLIAVSPGGLSIKTLAKILGTSPMEVKSVIDEYRQYLMCIDHGYRFFHKRIYEHLLYRLKEKRD